MDHRKKDELDPTYWSGSEEESMAMVPADASLDFMAQKLTAKKIKLLEKGDEAPQNRDSRIRFCGREFKSDKALRGHLRIHSQHQAKSKAGIHHIKSAKLARKHSPEEEEDDNFTCFVCEDRLSSTELLCQHMRNHHDIEEQEDGSFTCFVCDDSFLSIKLLFQHMRNHSEIEEEVEDDCFTCFVCEDRFSSMKLLCQHMRNHRETESNGIKQPIPSQESNSLSKAETTVEEGIDTVSPRNDQNQWSSIDLMKDMPNWSQTGKRGRKKTVSDKTDNKIYNPVPLRVHYGSSVPQMGRRLEEQDSTQSLLTRKKQKTEETMPNQDTSMESESADSASTVVELLGNCKQTATNKISTMPQGFEFHVSNKSKSSSNHGRLKNPKPKKTVKSVHQCEICGKMFQTGQALGGHKTSHRMKPVVVPFRVELFQRKAKEQLCGESGQAGEYITRMLLPGLMSQEADPSKESYQEHPKRLLDFNLNIAHEG